MVTHDLVEALERSQHEGHLGPGPITEHLDHGRAHVSAAVPRPGEHWCDLGSGGGIPGLVLAVNCPEITLTLVDRSSSRISFLRWAVRALDLEERVVAVEADAAELAHHPDHRHKYHGLVSRSFGPAHAVAEIASGFLAEDGRAVVSEPPALKDELSGERWPRNTLRTLGLEVDHLVDGPPRFVVLRRIPGVESPAPRTWKRIRKRPLY